MTAQILEADGKPAFAVLPYDEYLALLEAAEDASDAQELSRFATALAAGTEWTVPVAVVDRLLAGESPLRVWREARGLTAAALAAAVGVTPAHVFKLEAGKGEPSVSLLRRLARVLDVDLDMLLPAVDEQRTAAANER